MLKMANLDDKISYQARDSSSAQNPFYDAEEIGWLIDDITKGKGKECLRAQYGDIQGVEQLEGNQSTIVGRVQNKKSVLQQLGFEETKEGSYRALTRQDFLSDVVNKVSAGKIKRKYGSVFDVARVIDKNRTNEDVEDNLHQILQYNRGYKKESIDDFHNDVGRGVGLNALKERYQNCEFAVLLDLLSPQQSAVDYGANQEKIMCYKNEKSTDDSKESTLQEVIADIYAGASNKTLIEKHGKTFSLVKDMHSNWRWENRVANAESIFSHYVGDDESEQSGEEINVSDSQTKELCSIQKSATLKFGKRTKNRDTTSLIKDTLEERLKSLGDFLPEKYPELPEESYALISEDQVVVALFGDEEDSLTEPSTEWEIDEFDHMSVADHAAINYVRGGTVRDSESFSVLILSCEDDWLDNGPAKLGWEMTRVVDDDDVHLFDKGTLPTSLGYSFTKRDLPNQFEGNRYRSIVQIGPPISRGKKSIVPERKKHFDWIDYKDLSEYEPVLFNEVNTDNVAVYGDDYPGDLSLDPDGLEDSDSQDDITTDFNLPLLDSLVTVSDSEPGDLIRSLPLSTVFFPKINPRLYVGKVEDAVVPLGEEMQELKARGLRESPVVDDISVGEFEEEQEPIFDDVTSNEPVEDWTDMDQDFPFDAEARGTYPIQGELGLNRGTVFVETEPVGVHSREGLVAARRDSASDTDTLLERIKDKRPVPQGKIDEPVNDWTDMGQDPPFNPNARGTYPTGKKIKLGYEPVEKAWFKDEPEAEVEDWTNMTPRKKRRKKKAKKK